YAKALLEEAGHEVQLIDAQLQGLNNNEIRQSLQRFRPPFTVVTTQPSYLFWRCAPPELRIPQQLIREIRKDAGVVVGVGPHYSTTPRAALIKLQADVVVIGECEDILPELTRRWSDIQSI